MNVCIYDLFGYLVRKFDGVFSYQFQWDGRDAIAELEKKRGSYTRKIEQEKENNNEKTGAFEITNSVASPGASPVGLWHDSSNLWSGDSATNRVYRHNTDVGLSVAQAYVLPKAFRKNFKLNNFAGRKGTIWGSSERFFNPGLKINSGKIIVTGRIAQQCRR